MKGRSRLLSSSAVRVGGVVVAAVLLLVLLRLFVHVDSKGPALGGVQQAAGAPAEATMQPNGWPPCGTSRQRQAWVLAVARAAPDLARVQHAAPIEGSAPAPASLGDAVRQADGVVLAHAEKLSYDPILDGGYNFVTLSTQFQVDQTLSGSPPATVTLVLGTLIPGDGCAPVFEPLTDQPLVQPPGRVLLLLQHGRPEDPAGIYLLNDGTVTAGFTGTLADSVNGAAAQDFLTRIGSLLH